MQGAKREGTEQKGIQEHTLMRYCLLAVIYMQRKSTTRNANEAIDTSESDTVKPCSEKPQ